MNLADSAPVAALHNLAHPPAYVTASLDQLRLMHSTVRVPSATGNLSGTIGPRTITYFFFYYFHHGLFSFHYSSASFDRLPIMGPS